MRRKRTLAITLLFLLLLFIPPVWFTYREYRQARLDHALIAAIKAGDDQKALEALAEGASGEARDTGEPPTFRETLLHLWERLLHPATQQSIPNADVEHLPALLLLDRVAFEKVTERQAIAPNPAVVRSLLAHGAQVNDRDIQDNNPLWYATFFTNTDAVRLLLERRADVEASSRGLMPPYVFPSRWRTDERTPLIWAATWGRPDVVCLLLEHGAKVSPKDGYGRTAFDYAQRHREDPDSRKIAALLRQHGAK